MPTQTRDPHSSGRSYTVEQSPKCQKQLAKMEAGVRRRVEAKISSLGIAPRPPGTEKLKDSIYRVRVGTWRLIYVIDDTKRLVVAAEVRPRNERTYNGFR